MSDADHRRVSASDAFWRFSLALYARPGIAEALIRLQDRAGRDVNLMLFGLWLGVTRGRIIEAIELAAAAAVIAPVGGIVSRVRGLRRERATAAEPELRRRLLMFELAAERRAQSRLAAHCAAGAVTGAASDRLFAAQANLALYLGDGAGSPEAKALCEAVAALMRSAPP